MAEVFTEGPAAKIRAGLRVNAVMLSPFAPLRANSAQQNGRTSQKANRQWQNAKVKSFAICDLRFAF
jgi:hypothetical protein